MPRARVLVVDDSVVVRKLLSEALSTDGDLQVLTAPNGSLCLEKVAQQPVDLVILDIEMPGLNGLETLRELRARAPALPIVMFSALTERGGTLTLDALGLGASDYVTKPSTLRGAMDADDVCRALLARVRALLHLDRPAPGSRSPRLRAATPPTPSLAKALVIGASTGGPNALVEVLSALPPSFPLPILIVQHMPPLFTKLLAERLDQKLPFSVAEASSGVAVEPGRILIAPGDHHLTVLRDGSAVLASLNQGPPENSCRPAVDVLFRSAAATWGSAVMAVVLTGMGSDGTIGCEHVRAVGGEVLVQDEASSVIWSMPGSVVQAGLADAVIPVESMGVEIARRASRPRTPAEAV